MSSSSILSVAIAAFIGVLAGVWVANSVANPQTHSDVAASYSASVDTPDATEGSREPLATEEAPAKIDDDGDRLIDWTTLPSRSGVARFKSTGKGEELPTWADGRARRGFSDSTDYVVTLWARRASRTPGLAMDNVTIVTHMTLDRLPQLRRWCKTWRGPMSVSVFIRAEEDPSQVLDEITAPETPGKTACVATHVDFHVVQHRSAVLQESKEEDIDDGNAPNLADMYTHYPFNVQRNAALDGSVGQWVLLLDIDFEMAPAAAIRERKFSANYHQNVELHPALFGVAREDIRKTLAVVPCVETVNKQVTVPRTMDDLRKGLAEHEVVAFYGHHCKNCHLPTKVERFAGGDGKPYRVSFVEGYEPYVVAHRSQLPRYDERFIGRGWDKMSFFYELRAKGFQFVVLPGQFLIHSGRGDVPKKPTAEYMERQKDNAIMMHTFKADIRRKYEAFGAAVNDPETDNAFEPGTINWNEIASSVGSDRACVSRYRKHELTPEITEKLEQALGFACSVVDCSPLQPGGQRYYPRDIIAHADWAFDRYHNLAVERGTSHRTGGTAARPQVSSCDFNGMARLVSCSSDCHGCIARPTATDARVSNALAWVCSPHVLENCEAILAVLPRPEGKHNETRVLHEKAALLFSYYYSIHRCAMPDPLMGCFFDGAGLRVPCARVPA